MFLLFSNHALLAWTAKWWEGPLDTLNQPLFSGRSIVVLGGYCSYDSVSGRNRFSQSSDRLWQALQLAKPTANCRMVLSGGAANVYRHERGESAVIKEVLARMGVDMSFVLVDSLSRNTAENAAYSAKLFDANKLSKRIVLVTSAWHMYRARNSFEKQGFDVVPLKADYLSPTEPMVWTDYAIPSASTLASWDLLVREWVGILIYRIKGYV